MPTKEVNQLIDRVKQAGYETTEEKGGHIAVRHPDTGIRLYMLPSSPSDWRWRVNAVRDLVRLGVFNGDPWRDSDWNPNVRVRGMSGDGEPAVVVETPEVTDDHAKKTRDLVAKLRPLQVEASELAEVASFVSQEHVPTWPLTFNLLMGGTLNDEQRAPFERVVDLLERGQGDMIEKFFSLLRHARGLPLERELPEVAMQTTIMGEEVHHAEVVKASEPEPAFAFKAQKKPPEELVTPPAKEITMEATLPTTDIDEKVRNFIVELQQEHDRLMLELNRVDAVILTLTSQFGGIQVEQKPESRSVQPQPEQPRPRRGGRPPAGEKNTNEKVRDILHQGGEWTAKELAETLGTHESAPRNALKHLIIEGAAVVVNPGKRGGGPHSIPATYGSTKFYTKEGGE